MDSVIRQRVRVGLLLLDEKCHLKTYLTCFLVVLRRFMRLVLRWDPMGIFGLVSSSNSFGSGGTCMSLIWMTCLGSRVFLGVARPDVAVPVDAILQTRTIIITNDPHALEQVQQHG